MQRNIKDGNILVETFVFEMIVLISRYAEWIEITDEDNGRSYCYPIQRWIDKLVFVDEEKNRDCLFLFLEENTIKRQIYFSQIHLLCLVILYRIRLWN